jgi:hypothetical protein
MAHYQNYKNVQRERANCSVIFMCNIYSMANFKNWGYSTQKEQFSFYSSVSVYILRARRHRPNIGPLFQWRLQNLVRRPNTGTGLRYTYELYAWEKQKIHWYPFTSRQGLTALKTRIFDIHCQNLQSLEQKVIFNSVYRRVHFHNTNLLFHPMQGNILLIPSATYFHAWFTIQFLVNTYYEIVTILYFLFNISTFPVIQYTNT